MKPTISAKWLEKAAADLETIANESLDSWILIGQAHRYCENIGNAATLRKAATIKSISERREFLRNKGVSV